jgi:hypothetical protein
MRCCAKERADYLGVFGGNAGDQVRNGKVIGAMPVAMDLAANGPKSCAVR